MLFLFDYCFTPYTYFNHTVYLFHLKRDIDFIVTLDRLVSSDKCSSDTQHWRYIYHTRVAVRERTQTHNTGEIEFIYRIGEFTVHVVLPSSCTSSQLWVYKQIEK